MRKIIFLLFLCAVFSLRSSAQNVDSLKEVLRNLPSSDTTRCFTLKLLCDNLEGGENREYSHSLRDLCLSQLSVTKNSKLKNVYNRYLGYSYIYIAQEVKMAGKVADAVQYLEKAQKIFEDVKSIDGISVCLNELAAIDKRKGNIQAALNKYEKSLKLFESVKNEEGKADVIGNMGLLYYEQGDTAKALEFYRESLAIQMKLTNKTGIAQAYNNMGMLYYHSKNVPLAVNCFEKSTEIYKEVGDTHGYAAGLNNIGFIYQKSGNIAKGLEYYLKVLEIVMKAGDKIGLSYTYDNIGAIYLYNKEYDKAEKYLKSALEVSRELGFPDNISNNAGLLATLYNKTGKYKEAYEMQCLFSRMKDSINNENTRKASLKSQLKLEYEKKAAADSVAHAKENEIRNAELAAQKAEVRAKQNQQIALFGGMALLIAFVVFIYNRFKLSQKQKKIIEEQKDLVEEKQKEIMDSIHYARRIQQAMMPSEAQMGKSLERFTRKS